MRTPGWSYTRSDSVFGDMTNNEDHTFGIAALSHHGVEDEDAAQALAAVERRLPSWRQSFADMTLNNPVERIRFFQQFFGLDASRAAEVLWRAVQPARPVRIEKQWGDNG